MKQSDIILPVTKEKLCSITSAPQDEIIQYINKKKRLESRVEMKLIILMDF